VSGREAKWRRVLISGVAAAVAAALVIGGVQATRNSGPAPVAVVDSGGSSDRVTLAGTDPITGRKVDLADFRGKAVVINIWASWCPGCVAEAADLRRFAEVHPEAQVLGIDIQDTKAAARTFYAEWGWTWPSVFDPSGSISARFALQGLPTTLFLDREHRVVARIVGEGSFERFEAGLERAAAG
jgi:thiol-disulfide isomerase/thioredoxin